MNQGNFDTTPAHHNDMFGWDNVSTHQEVLTSSRYLCLCLREKTIITGMTHRGLFSGV